MQKQQGEVVDAFSSVRSFRLFPCMHQFFSHAAVVRPHLLALVVTGDKI